MNMKPLKTLTQAIAYARRIEALTGNRHHVFVVPHGTIAHEAGYRFATCTTADRAAYADDGAQFVWAHARGSLLLRSGPQPAAKKHAVLWIGTTSSGPTEHQVSDGPVGK